MQQWKTGQSKTFLRQARGSSLWMSLQNCVLCAYSHKTTKETGHVSTCLEFPLPTLVTLKICELIGMSPLLLLPFSLMGQGGIDQLADLHGIFPYLWGSGSEHWKRSATAAFAIIILCYTDYEVDKTRCCLFRCAGEKKKDVETHTWRSQGDKMSWCSAFHPTHFRPVSICRRPWEQQWSSVKVNGDLKSCPFHLNVQKKKASTVEQKLFSLAEITGKIKSMPVSIEVQFSFWNPHIKTQTTATSKYSHSNA